MIRLSALFFLALLSVELGMACKKGEPEKSDPVSEGRAIYTIHCTACHSYNPSADGSLGPALKGSSLELLQARVLRGEYPAGYAPKRNTHIMQKLPLEEADVEALHAFLNAPD